jgi:hypothetical protein
VDKQALSCAITRSGGGKNAIDEVDTFWPRIELLQQAGRYGPLLSQLCAANDKSNFLALILEINFAYQFESRGLALTYEVKQAPAHNSSIDFLRVLPSDDHVYLEVRLLQEAQPDRSEKDDIIRVQSTILSKVQKTNGTPIKFFSTATNAVNIVVIDASSSILGMLDFHDCMLATHGDTHVEEVFRRGIFGLFQEDRPAYPDHIHELAAKYRRIKETLHAVLFLFRPEPELLVYRVEQYLIWNPALIDTKRAESIYADISSAVPFHTHRKRE